MHREIDYYPSHGKKVIVLLVGKSNKALDETAQELSVNDFGSGYILL